MCVPVRGRVTFVPRRSNSICFRPYKTPLGCMEPLEAPGAFVGSFSPGHFRGEHASGRGQRRLRHDAQRDGGSERWREGMVTRLAKCVERGIPAPLKMEMGGRHL